MVPATWGDKVLKEEREYKGIDLNILFITWLRKEDKVRAIGDYMNLNNGTTGDMGWCERSYDFKYNDVT